jgi:hypothetical protein
MGNLPPGFIEEDERDWDAIERRQEDFINTQYEPESI